MILHVYNNTDKQIDQDIFQLKFKIFLEKMSDHLQSFKLHAEDIVEFFLTNDDEVQKINRDFRGQDKPTDVISCAYLEVSDTILPPGPKVIGDMFISIDTAKKQALERDHNLEKELEILFVHGLLHLFGFDHQNDEEEAEMEKYAQRILGY
jgi:probable rRNA maturation factor